MTDEAAMTDITMSAHDYHALIEAREHTLRALSAAKATRPFDSTAMVALDVVREQLQNSLRVLESIKARARVTA